MFLNIIIVLDRFRLIRLMFFFLNDGWTDFRKVFNWDLKLWKCVYKHMRKMLLDEFWPAYVHCMNRFSVNFNLPLIRNMILSWSRPAEEPWWFLTHFKLFHAVSMTLIFKPLMNEGGSVSHNIIILSCINHMQWIFHIYILVNKYLNIRNKKEENDGVCTRWYVCSCFHIPKSNHLVEGILKEGNKKSENVKPHDLKLWCYYTH